MLAFLKWLVLVPLIVIAVGFALANQQQVKVSFDLFEQGVTPFETQPLPLYAVMLACAGLGLFIGGALVWLSQGRHRKAARLARREASGLRREVEAARPAPAPGSTALTVR